jgi:colanic acid biosynthesis glycosyl transferase WcaI
MGHEVSVICGFPHYGGEVWPRHAGRFYESEHLNGVDIKRVFVWSHKGMFWRRLLYHASYNVASTVAAILALRPDVILADAPSLWSGLPLLLKAVCLRVPFIYVVHDIYPDVAVRLGVLSSPMGIRWVARMERWYYDHAAYISVLSDDFKSNLIRKGVPAQKIEVIPPCTDVDTIRPMPLEENRLRKEWGLAGKFVVLYTANIGLPQGLDNTVRAAGILAGHPDIAFVMVGEGAAKESLEAMVRDMGLMNVHFFPLQRREVVPQVFGLADVSLVSLKREIFSESVPSKTFSIMASGRPVLAAVRLDSEVAVLVAKAKCGVCVEPGEPQALASAVLELYRDRTQCSAMGTKGREFVVQHFSRQVAANKYQSLIDRIINDRTPLQSDL